jgi:hypothetical protein
MKKPGKSPGFSVCGCCARQQNAEAYLISLWSVWRLRCGLYFFLDPLRDGLFVAPREVAGDGLALFFGFGALQGDEFLHGVERIEGSEERAPPRRCNPKLQDGN